MKITICIGSSCHLKGSRQVIEELQNMVIENELSAKIDLVGTFCMGNCQNGVCVKIDEDQFSLKSENTRGFFEKEVLSRL